VTPFVVGVAGGTASGKTSVAERLARRFGALLVSHDRYYRDFADPSVANFDHPDSLETTLLVAQLDGLRRGETVSLPRYDFTVHRRAPEVDVVEPRPLVVVEGILVLADAALRGRFDLRVYGDAPDDIRFIRRLRRDLAERGRTVDGVVAQYLATVRPMHEAFVVPSKAHADVVLDGMAPLDGLVDGLVGLVRVRMG
jgi:uridine kinase